MTGTEICAYDDAQVHNVRLALKGRVHGEGSCTCDMGGTETCWAAGDKRCTEPWFKMVVWENAGRPITTGVPGLVKPWGEGEGDLALVKPWGEGEGDLARTAGSRLHPRERP